MSRVQPVRTCVGCRKRAAKSDLLRVVVQAQGPTGSVVPDVQATRRGRGAYLHPDLACLEQAERRRAFSRALRCEGALDVSALRAWLETQRQTSPGA
ncbi:MAG: YlxR family protein [Nocardioidaceae bacterium]